MRVFTNVAIIITFMIVFVISIDLSLALASSLILNTSITDLNHKFSHFLLLLLCLRILFVWSNWPWGKSAICRPSVIVLILAYRRMQVVVLMLKGVAIVIVLSFLQQFMLLSLPRLTLILHQFLSNLNLNLISNLLEKSHT